MNLFLCVLTSAGVKLSFFVREEREHWTVDYTGTQGFLSQFISFVGFKLWVL